MEQKDKMLLLKAIGDGTDDFKTMANNYKKLKDNTVEEGKIYALIAGPDEPCIANGNTWKESEVKEESRDSSR